MAGWTVRDMPGLSGRVAVVTGANSGLGYVTARELARRGARTVLACRSPERGEAAVERLRAEVPDADVELARLDLGSLASVREFADGFAQQHDRLDLLVDNAGVMALPYRLTEDGFESQFGVNHLGHFALTGLLMPALVDTAGARVVVLSSGMHALAGVDLNDVNSERRYRRWVAYARSKSANLLFVHELARRLAAAGSEVIAAAAHPGYAATNLQTAGARMEQRRAAELMAKLGNRVLGESPEQGALPTLYAATAPGVRPDSFTGPGPLGLRGAPTESWRARWTRDDQDARVLWTVSERLTGVTYAGL
ncbi:oxidoreductase [Streptomyces sp. NPDC058045]|uniref:oxidoreductase n=1 Tax=Streptomyces sp. NPDC058045 TaxID=3346311 RepID=UPI0036EA9720